MPPAMDSAIASFARRSPVQGASRNDGILHF